MDLFNKTKQSSKTNKSNSQKPNNFIEAIKDISSNVKQQTKDLTLGTSRGVIDQVLGTDQATSQQTAPEDAPDKALNFEEYLKSREKQIEQTQKARYEKRIRQEVMIFHRREQEAKLQIQSIQEELKKLAEVTIELSQEVKQAVFMPPAEIGTYHLTFFARIRRVIEIARKKIADSKTWFTEFNRRRKRKQCFFWMQAKKSGTRFTLSQERYSSMKG